MKESPSINPAILEDEKHVRLFQLLQTTNPANDWKHLRSILGVSPFKETITKSMIDRSGQQEYPPFPFSAIPDNSEVMGPVECEKLIREARGRLGQIFSLTRSAPIVFIADNCFTNTCLKDTLHEIIGEQSTDWIRQIDVCHERVEYPFTANEISPEDTISIFGGSYIDPYKINNPYFFNPEKNPMVQCLIEGMTQKRYVVSVCFSQQVAAILKNHIDRTSPRIPAVIQGAAQFGPTGCMITESEQLDPLDRDLLIGLTNRGRNQFFSAIHTRTGHIIDVGGGEFGSKRDTLHPLVFDMITGEPFMWRMGTLLAIAGHPEITRAHKKIVYHELESIIIPFLQKHFSCRVEDIYENFEAQDHWKADVGIPAWAGILNAFAKKLIGEDVTVIFYPPKPLDTLSYDDLMAQIMGLIRKRVRFIEAESIGQSEGKFSKESLYSLLALLDSLRTSRKDFRLELNDQIDWKVNRSIKEASVIAGLDIFDTMLAQDAWLRKNGMRDKFFFACDKGAGNGFQMKEIIEKNKLSEKNGTIERRIDDLILYGVADQVYFDLFQGIKNLPLVKNLSKKVKKDAEDIIVLLVEKIVDLYHTEKKYAHLTLKDGLAEIVNRIQLNAKDTIKKGSMFASETYMFPREMESPLSDSAKEFLLSGQGKEFIASIKEIIKTDLYSLFESQGYLERILLHRFQNFHPSDPVLLKKHYQYSIRSTSHLSSNDYKDDLGNYISVQTIPGSLYVDNGVHQSYTSTPRIKELLDIQRKFGDDVRISLVYDPKTNYFCSAIIETPLEKNGEKIYRDTPEDIEKNSTWYHANELLVDEKNTKPEQKKRIVSIEAAGQSVFFRIERWLRDFIMICFRDYSIFYYFNADIIECLKTIASDIADTRRLSSEKVIKGYIKELFEKIKKKIDTAPAILEMLQDLHDGSIAEKKANIFTLENYIRPLGGFDIPLNTLFTQTKKNPTKENIIQLRKNLEEKFNFSTLAKLKEFGYEVKDIDTVLDEGMFNESSLQEILSECKGKKEPDVFNLQAERKN